MKEYFRDKNVEKYLKTILGIENEDHSDGTLKTIMSGKFGQETQEVAVM